MLKGKTVLIGVTGSIAAYKIAYLVSALKKRQADVRVIMTKNAANFITPVTFETLSGSRCITDTFDRGFTFEVEHVSLAKKADLLLVAPASADVIGKLSAGIADDMLTTTALAVSCPKFIAPAMNTAMFKNPVVQDNLLRLKSYGWEVIDPAEGYLACGESGEGRMPEPDVLFSYIERELSCEKDLRSLKVLVTAGPTCEAIDPVRFITNHSTGKMGYAIAHAAMLRGADVTLISGRTALKPPPFVRVIPVISAKDMFEAVTSISDGQDIIIKAAAVADYRPAKVSGEKIKKSENGISLPLERTRDILGFLGEHKRPGQFLCGFSMETSDVIANSRAKLMKKNLDLIAANNLKEEGAGFGTGTNILTLISRDDEAALPLMSKEDAAMRLLDAITGMRNGKKGDN